VRTVRATRREHAHIIGLSMGGFATLHFGLAYPSMARSLLIASCGYGADPNRQAEFNNEMERTAARIERETMAEFARGPRRVQSYGLRVHHGSRVGTLGSARFPRRIPVYAGL